ncbi:MAG: hypothetical protein RR201_01535 [Malacoplasma sp.]
MITKENDIILLKINEHNLYFDGEEYEKTLLYLTDPNIILPEEVNISETIISDDDKHIASTYKDFVNSFIKKRKETDLLFINDEIISN